MPRANRHYIPGYVWHITHRCHKKEFLLKFARDRPTRRSSRPGTTRLNWWFTPLLARRREWAPVALWHWVRPGDGVASGHPVSAGQPAFLPRPIAPLLLSCFSG